MKCPLETREDREILVAYSSRALNAGDAGRLEAHLESCAACAEFVRGQRAVWEALDGWEAAPVSAGFDRRLMARIAGQASWRERLRRSPTSALERASPFPATRV